MWNAYGPSGARRALCVTVGWVALSASIVGFSRAIGAWVVPGAVVGHHSGFVFIFLTVV